MKRLIFAWSNILGVNMKSVLVVCVMSLAIGGCVSRHELSKAEEDRKVLESSDKSADEILEGEPKYLTDIAAVSDFADRIRKYCNAEELAGVNAAYKNCCDSIKNGASEQERRNCFRRLYEYQYREFLRWTHRRAGELADEYTGKKEKVIYNEGTAK